jgi:hypothetical protein
MSQENTPQYARVYKPYWTDGDYSAFSPNFYATDSQARAEQRTGDSRELEVRVLPLIAAGLTAEEYKRLQSGLPISSAFKAMHTPREAGLLGIRDIRDIPLLPTKSNV